MRFERGNFKTNCKSDVTYQDCFVRHRVVLENKAVYMTWELINLYLSSIPDYTKDNSMFPNSLNGKCLNDK